MTTQTNIPRVKRRKDPVRTPLWRRLTALVSLSSIVIIVAVVLALLIGGSILLALVFLERAASG